MSTSFLSSTLGDFLPGFGTLSGLKFFEPNKSFYAKMAEDFPTRHIFDIGAGVGHVSKGLAAAGLLVSALDFIARDNSEFPVLLANAIGFDYPADAVLLFCRPCHGYFVEATIKNGLNCGVKDFVYAGLAKNVADDLGMFRRCFKTVMRNVGEDNESLYVMRRE